MMDLLLIYLSMRVRPCQQEGDGRANFRPKTGITTPCQGNAVTNYFRLPPHGGNRENVYCEGPLAVSWTERTRQR